MWTQQAARGAVERKKSTGGKWDSSQQALGKASACNEKEAGQGWGCASGIGLEE